MSSMTPVCSTVSIARAVIDYIDELKNSRIDGVSLDRLKTLIQTLSDVSNLKLLQGFPIEIIIKPIDDIRFEIGGSYHPKLKFAKMTSFAINTLEQAERFSDESGCLDALRVLVNYGNIVVFSRTDHFLVIRQKKLDDCNSSNELVETSTHLVNGDDSCIT